MAVNIMPSSVCQCCSCCHCFRRGTANPLLLKPPTAAEESDVDARDPGAALAAAAHRPGGQAEALRHLSNVMNLGRDPLKYIDSDELSCILRAGKRYDQFVCLARPDFGRDGWSTGLVEESKLWFAHRVDRCARSIHAVLVQDIEGVDAVRAAVGYCAAGLFREHSPDVQSCKVLAESEDSVLWDQVSQSSDDIVQVDLVNALDEPLGAIVLVIRPQPEGSPDFPETRVPASTRRRRSRSDRQCITLTPLPGGSVRMHVAAVSCLGDAQLSLEVERSSTEAMAKLLRPLVAVWPKRFAAFVREHREELVHHEAFSPQAPFFAVCRGYLSGSAGSKLSSLHRWGFLFGGAGAK
mmetsp:Transcript_2189/g.7328  ORF Transcript_2189/g.7328 Transcript_2189/m.7328 type:complete len:352 (-) Transcript_2189:3-1058(-)